MEKKKKVVVVDVRDDAWIEIARAIRILGRAPTPEEEEEIKRLGHRAPCLLAREPPG